jgi:hypothetical protein
VTLSTRDQVRLLIGDTDADDPLLTDSEVDNFVTYRSVLNDSGGTITTNVPAAAADCAGAIAAEFARTFDFAEDGQRFNVSQRVGHYQALERELRNRSGGVAVGLGGTITST